MLKQLKTCNRKTTYYTLVIQYRQKKEYTQWLKNGKIGLTPHLINQATVKAYADQYKMGTFIETGTFMGEMVFAVKEDIIRIHKKESHQ